jgi:signal transduction histidine kinase
MRPLSLRSRISLLFAAVLAVVVAGFSIVAYIELGEALSAALPNNPARVAHEMREFLRMLLVAGGGMALGGTVAGTAIVLWGLRPIRRTADRVRGITHRNLASERLEDVRPPGELVPFVAAVSEMLARLNEVLRRQRQFTADASHEHATATPRSTGGPSTRHSATWTAWSG